MIVWRIAKDIFINDLSGRGAELNGGRWNRKGRAVVYTASTLSLALLESLAYTPISILNNSYRSAQIEIPEKYVSIKSIKVNNLGAEWWKYPAGSETKNIGEDWFMGQKKLLLKVPSVMVNGEFNYLINTRHQHFGKVKIIKTGALTINNRLQI